MSSLAGSTAIIGPSILVLLFGFAATCGNCVRVHFKPEHRAFAQALRLVVTKIYPL